MSVSKFLKRASTIVLLLVIAFISFLLYQTKDDINANLSNVEGLLESYCNQKKMAGFGAAVFSSDSIIYTNGFGYADMKTEAPYTIKTEQFIASISKTSIGIALLKAEELGLLTLEDSINSHLPFRVFNPHFPNIPITIQQLATHTSSLLYNEHVVESLYITDSTKQISISSFMTNYFDHHKYGEVTFSKNAPGTNWDYSNLGAGLAAYIIEQASGNSFSSFAQKHIFDPLEMNNTTWFLSNIDSNLQSKYYESSEDSIREISSTGIVLYPCRDLNTNVTDLTKYCQAILSQNPSVLTKSSWERLLSAKLDGSVSNMEDDNIGTFFFIDRNNYGINYQLTGHDGGDRGIHTMMWIDRKTKLGFIFLGNTGYNPKNRRNHIFIANTLVSLGDHHKMNSAKISDKIAHKWYNFRSRVTSLF